MADLSCSTRRGRRLKPRAWDYSDSCRILRDHDVFLEEETGISSLGGENKILCKQRGYRPNLENAITYEAWGPQMSFL